MQRISYIHNVVYKATNILYTQRSPDGAEAK